MPALGIDRLTFTGILVGVYLAVFLCQLDLYIRRQEWVTLPAVYILLASQAVMAIAIWYLTPDLIGRVLKASGGAILAFARALLRCLSGYRAWPPAEDV